MSQSFYKDYPSVAVVTLWMSFETAMRELLTVRGERIGDGMSGTAMARKLRDLGELDDDDVRRISELSQLRNNAVHGYEVHANPTKELLALAEKLLREAGIFQETLSKQRFIQG